MCITPLLQFLVCICYHTAAHSWDGKQLHIITRVSAHQHTIVGQPDQVLDLHCHKGSGRHKLMREEH